MSLSSNSNSNNLCVICLEPLLKVADDDDDDCDCNENSSPMADVGTTSCGHPVHGACFDSWAQFQEKQGEEGSGIPCPTCQQETASFTKLYLRAEPKSKEHLSDEDDEEEESDKSEERPSTAPRRTKNAPVKKAQYYKKRWQHKTNQVKALKLEAKNRRKCHHEDLVDLERSQLLNFRLMKQLESTIKAARFRRNAVGMVCFVAGWVCSRKWH